MKKTIIALSLIAVASSAYNKKDECKGGSGGNLTLVLLPQHHAKAIPSQSNYRDTAYIKFNTNNAPPAGGSYNLIVVGEVGEDHINVPNLKCGDYYVFMAGFDTSVAQRVKGAAPISTSQKDGELEVNISIAE